MAREHEPGSKSEELGIPDLDGDSPEQQWASDPQEAPLPGEKPLGVDEWGTTETEQLQGEPLELRLSREEPDFPATSAEADVPANLYEPTRDHAGRLVAPDEGARAAVDPELTADEVGADGGGYAPEEIAMHVEPEPGEDGSGDE